MKITVELDGLEDLNAFVAFHAKSRATAEAVITGNTKPATPAAETKDPAPADPADTGNVIKLVGKQHKQAADEIIESGSKDDPRYEVLSAAQKKRVDDALAGNSTSSEESDDADFDFGDGEDGNTPVDVMAGKSPEEQREMLVAKMKELSATGDSVKLNAARTAMVEMLDEQGTTYDKPKQSLIEAKNVPAFYDALEKILKG